MIDPQHGDYRLAPDSPAQGYGCQTFRRADREPPPEPPPPSICPGSYRNDLIEVSGSIDEDTVWSADTVSVVGDLTIEDGVTLTIQPGVRIEFQDYYRLDVAGTLLAVGTPACGIVFTTDEPQEFSVGQSHSGCWNGIRFDRTPATNARSHLEYCIFEYSKATGSGDGAYPYGGGAISVVDFSELTIENCIIRNCVADYGGAIFLYRQANPRIAGNLIVNNHALENAAALYCAYSYPEMINNTIVANSIQNEDNPYIESCAVLSFLAKPVFTNNIIRDNNPEVLYLHIQLWNNKDYYTCYNNIEDYENVGGNIDADPLFAAPASDDYHLSPESPCIDAGLNAALSSEADLDGLLRFADRPVTPDTGGGTVPLVDMGVYEYQCRGDLNGDGAIDLADLAHLLAHYADTSGSRSRYADGDLDLDGDVNLSDLAALLAVYGLSCP